MHPKLYETSHVLCCIMIVDSKLRPLMLPNGSFMFVPHYFLRSFKSNPFN